MRHASRLLLVATTVSATALAVTVAVAQSEQEKRAPSEAEQILRDSQKQDPETPKELDDCIKQWGPNTQMTKEEWATSCRSTLRYFPESAPAR